MLADAIAYVVSVPPPHPSFSLFPSLFPAVLRSYSVSYLGNVVGGDIVRYINLPIEELKARAQSVCGTLPTSRGFVLISSREGRQSLFFSRIFFFFPSCSAEIRMCTLPVFGTIVSVLYSWLHRRNWWRFRCGKSGKITPRLIGFMSEATAVFCLFHRKRKPLHSRTEEFALLPTCATPTTPPLPHSRSSPPPPHFTIFIARASSKVTYFP